MFLCFLFFFFLSLCCAVACFIYFFISLGFQAAALHCTLCRSSKRRRSGSSRRNRKTSASSLDRVSTRTEQERERDRRETRWDGFQKHNQQSSKRSRASLSLLLLLLEQLTMFPRVRSINMLRYQRNLSSHKQQCSNAVKRQCGEAAKWGPLYHVACGRSGSHSGTKIIACRKAILTLMCGI